MGVHNMVKRMPKAEHVTVTSNGCAELPPIANGITTPSVAIGDHNAAWYPFANEHQTIIDDGTACFSKQAAVAKVSAVSSLFGKAGSIGFGKALDSFDRFGSSITNWDPILYSDVQIKGNTISILAFEVANSVSKGAKLMQSLSEDNIRYLKEVLLPSKMVQSLISADMHELLKIAAADKRDVVRFGNRTYDPSWHNLDYYFRKVGSRITVQTHLKKQAESGMEYLTTLVQSTAMYTRILSCGKLCHEFHSLGRLEQEYRHKFEEDSSVTARRGDNLTILKADVKNQIKLVNGLKKKSLWSKTFDEVVPKLVDIVQLLHIKIEEAFGITGSCCYHENIMNYFIEGFDRTDLFSNHQKAFHRIYCHDDEPVEHFQRNCKTLGPAGTSLHYAHIITQINSLGSQSSLVPQSVIDTLYEGLPCSIKSNLRSKFQLVELTIPQIKAEMKRTLDWLLPVAVNTTKAVHGFGWVGEWTNVGFEASWHIGLTGTLRIVTLHHASEKKTEAYICELLVLLHHLISQVGVGHGGMPSSPVESRGQRTNELTAEDQEMLKDVATNNIRLGMSKSQKSVAENASRLSKQHRLSKSSRDFLAKDKLPIENLLSRPIDSDITWLKLLDVIDGVDTMHRP